MIPRTYTVEWHGMDAVADEDGFSPDNVTHKEFRSYAPALRFGKRVEKAVKAFAIIVEEDGVDVAFERWEHDGRAWFKYGEVS